MNEDLSSRLSKWLSNFSSFEGFEISNKNLNRLIWQRQKRLLIVALIALFLLVLMDLIQIPSAEWEGRGRMQTVAGFISGALLIIVLLAQWMLILLKRKKLFVVYPELNNELANLVDGDYVDEELQVYIYGQHLVVITVADGLSILDLYEYQFLEITSKALSYSLIFYVMTVTLDDGRQVRIKVPNYPSIDTREKLEDLETYIKAYYGN